MTDEFFQERLAALRAHEQRIRTVVRIVEDATVVAVLAMMTLLRFNDELNATTFVATGVIGLAAGFAASRIVAAVMRERANEQVEREFPLLDGTGRPFDAEHWL